MKLYEFGQVLKSCSSLPQLNEALERYLRGLGIKTFAFTYHSYYPNSLNKLKYDFSSTNLAIWHKHYISEHYEDVDTTLDVVYRTSIPIFWDLQQQLKEAKTPREKQMRLDSIQYGTEKGLSIPIHGPQEDFAILMVAQMRGEDCLENWQELQYELLSAAYYFYVFLQRQLLKNIVPEKKERLLKRDIQCLTLLAKQYSNEAIAQALNITERTVNYHIQRLNKKLGTNNKYQSVIKALNKGLIKL